MKTFFQRLFKFLAYSAAGVVILLAVAVGLFRLFLPRLPEYQEQIKGWASSAIGMRVEFSGMDARWGLSGPELEFYDAELLRPSTEVRVLAADEVSISVAMISLLVDRTLVLDRVTVRDTGVELRQLDGGGWWVQGVPVDELLEIHTGGSSALGDIEVIGEDIELIVIQPGDERPTFFDVPRVDVQKDEVRTAVSAALRLPDELGDELRFSATRVARPDEPPGDWDIDIVAEDLNLAGVADLVRDDRMVFGSGRGEIDLSIAFGDSGVSSAAALIDFAEISIGDSDLFDVAGRIEFRRDDDGWLVAADRFRATTSEGTWPSTSLRVETSTDRDGQIVMIDARADYLNLKDLELLLPFAGDEQRQQFAQWAPDGVVRNLIATLSDVDTERPRYAAAADLERAGFAAHGSIPGIRGFTGRLRADSAGGRLEIRSEDMTLDAPRFVPETIPVDDAFGTVIWRSSRDRTTILSDNIAIRNADLDSQSNVQITIDGDSAPVIDLASTWSLTDISSAKRFIPEPVMHPKLFEWFQNALVSGFIPRGTTRLYGPLDKFPFDNDEGRLLVEASIEDLTFQFLRQWPAAEISDMDVVLDNTRLYTNRNRSVSQGRQVVDAKVEIADLREGVLTIDAYSTGTMEAIKDYAVNSPIGGVFGGQLERVSVAGDASFSLDLYVPLKAWREFTFTTNIVTNNGSLMVEGFEPPVTELNGTVTIERDSVTSTGLSGVFLGQPVEIELKPAPEDMPGYQVVANASGTLTAGALVNELKLPLQERLAGLTPYNAQLRFPRGGQETPSPFEIRIDTMLEGIAVDMPAPFAKGAEESVPTSAAITFAVDGTGILSTGTAATSDPVEWSLAFTNAEGFWDLDRGMLTVGGGDPVEAETRGLHIRGSADSIRLEDWLALSREDPAEANAAERIRSIELELANLRLLGQHYENHSVRVDRSARDWLVQLDGDEVSGSVFVPYEFTADRALVLDMEKLVLPGDELEEETEPGSIDPRTLPPISIRAVEFGMGERSFGSIEADIARTDEGLVAENIITSDASFEIVGNGSWLADETDDSGFRTSMMATLRSTNVEETMRRLKYEPGIVSDDMTMLLDLGWSGNPRADFLDTLDGEVQVRFGNGNLDEIEPGAGRVFGLMSIVALPRRLSLDFSDVFGKGFGFDKIEGTFRIVDGEAYTCNLSLEGPAADIGIIGRASLVSRDYEQTAVVSANFGNTLPVVGAVVAGPQAAAALLIFSQIFKKPLKEVSQVYYTIDGSWDAPSIESSDAGTFAAKGEAAGCIAETE